MFDHAGPRPDHGRLTTAVRYLLSNLIPVPMRSRYGMRHDDGPITWYRATWVQWRHRIFRHRVQEVTS